MKTANSKLLGSFPLKKVITTSFTPNILKFQLNLAQAFGIVVIAGSPQLTSLNESIQ
jgi:hypothetical protein